MNILNVLLLIRSKKFKISHEMLHFDHLLPFFLSCSLNVLAPFMVGEEEEEEGKSKLTLTAIWFRYAERISGAFCGRSPDTPRACGAAERDDSGR